jgi:virginiamycin B lyase
VAVGRITPSGAATEFSLSPVSSPRGVTAGPDGALWFTESGVSVAGRITTSGSISEFLVATFPHGIALGPDGALWLAGCKGAGGA